MVSRTNFTGSVDGSSTASRKKTDGILASHVSSVEIKDSNFVNNSGRFGAGLTVTVSPQTSSAKHNKFINKFANEAMVMRLDS